MGLGSALTAISEHSQYLESHCCSAKPDALEGRCFATLTLAWLILGGQETFQEYMLSVSLVYF